MKRTWRACMMALLIGLGAVPGFGQEESFTAVRAEVDFSTKLRDWDGFGVNYVEVAQSLDPATDP